MKRILIYILLLIACSVCSAFGASESPLSEDDKTRIIQVLKDVLKLKIITQEQYNKQIEWVNSTPCDGVDRSLAESKKDGLAKAIAKQLQLTTVDVLQSFKADGWSIIYVDTHVSDEAYLFYSSDPIAAAQPVTEWSGAATVFETSEIEQWILENAPGIPKRLASCFAWHVTLNRDK
jgi:hypothetical protein